MKSDADAVTEIVPEEMSENPSDTVRASWNFSLDRIRQSTGHFLPEEQDALVALFRWCIDDQHPMRRDEASRRLGISSNLLYQLLTGIYRDPHVKDAHGKIVKQGALRRPPPDLVKKINDFLALEAKRFNSGQTEFVLTPVAKKIFHACDLARERQTPVILWGTSHLGKTWALKQYAQQNNHGKTFVAELDAASGLGGMVRILATACGITGAGNTAALIERIKKALTPNTLLIVDEVHLLKHTYRLNSFFACIETLRRIYDKTKCGMVLSWTNLENLKNASQDELIQLWRRGTYKFALGRMPGKQDIGCILHHYGFNGEDIGDRKFPNCVFPAPDYKVQVPNGRAKPIEETPYEVLRSLARSNGLKAITERINQAGNLAKKDGARVSWRYFCEAHLCIEADATEEKEWT